MAKIWTPHRIRMEIQRLDRLTGLSGAELPIEMDRRSKVAGMFSVCGGDTDGVMYFSFSSMYFQNPDHTEDQALDVIRHEYAHYMVFMRHGTQISDPHGPEWVACCAEVDALPTTVAPTTLAEFLRKKYPERFQDPPTTEWKIEDTIYHPLFHEGTVFSVEKDGAEYKIGVEFPPCPRYPKVSKRYFTSSWLRTHTQHTTAQNESKPV